MEDMREQEPQLIDLREFVGILRRRKFILLVSVAVVIFLAIGLVARRTPVYSATSRVEVRPLTAENTQYESFYDLQSSMDTESARVTSSTIAKSAELLGAPVEAHISASVPANTTFIDITCSSIVPSEAQVCANAYAKAYVDDRDAQANTAYEDAARGPRHAIESADEQIAELTNQLRHETDPDLRNQYVTAISSERQAKETAQLQLLNVPSPSATPALVSMPAELPSVPSNKNYVTTGILALILGGGLGIGLAFARDRLDERVGGRKELEQDLRAPVIALVPKAPGQRGGNETRLITM